jgi:superfamily II DNA or RNA helicase
MQKRTTSIGRKTNLAQIKLKPGYNTEDDDIVVDLYVPCLRAASRYDRAVGYFRANIYRELGEELLDFVRNGGRVRIVCSPDIPAPDEEAARQGYQGRDCRSDREREVDLTAIMKVMAESPEEKDCLEMLRLLIEMKVLDLFVAVRPGGIYHRKIGRFSDDVGNFVVFSGSGNETERAVSSIEDWSNDEEFDVFRSWGQEYEKERATAKGNYLDRLFAGGTVHTVVRPLTETEREVLARFRSHNDLDDCQPGARIRSNRRQRSTSGPVLGGVQLFYYQTEAIRKWEGAGRVGLLSMATATGKTFTALFALRPLLSEGWLCLIVVPTSELLTQWFESIRRLYPDVPVLRAGAGYAWREDKFKRMYVVAVGKPRIVLATMQTASGSDFLEFIAQADRCVLVADEAHRLGSEKYRRILELPFPARLGLSATPERLYDPEGSEAISKAFGAVAVFNLPIGGRVRLSSESPSEVPILGHFLSRYTYGFQTVELAAAEQARWDKLTKELSTRMARIKGGGAADAFADLHVKQLLIERARVVKLASAKVDAARAVILNQYPTNGRWIVYCENLEQLGAVTRVLRQARPEVAIMPYHSQLPGDERAQNLQYFESNPSILVSIRCLDEGVDLRAADGGVILASSSNPREYVQRRGRLLRKFPGKTRATIIDTLVLPRISPNEEGIPVSIVRGEIARAYRFAKDAENREIRHELWRICQEYHVETNIDAEIGFELDGASDEQ